MSKKNKLNAELCLGSDVAGSQENVLIQSLGKLSQYNPDHNSKNEEISGCTTGAGHRILPLSIGLVFENNHAGNVLTFPFKSHLEILD